MPQLFRRVLVPHDFSAHADRALRVAADLARGARGRLVVLHVLVPYPMTEFTTIQMSMVLTPDFVARSRKRLVERVGRVLGRRAVTADVRVVIGDPASEIARVAGRAGSIVMATEGRTGLSHLLIGSVAEKVVRHATCPVLTLRGGRSRRRHA